MRMGILIASCLLLAGCPTPVKHQKGGSSEISVPVVRVVQPENPLGPSTSNWVEVTVTTAPDGTVVRSERRISTSVGGSQDLADIITEYMQGKYFKSLLTALGLAAAAWWMYRKQWEWLATGLLAAAIIALLYGSMAGLAAAALSTVAIVVAYFKTSLTRLP